MTTKLLPSVCILGVNGFIGSHLLDRLLSENYSVVGIDIESYRIEAHITKQNFRFFKRDFRTLSSDLRKQLRDIDVIIPLVAIATPKTYVEDPIRVFELDFEANLPYIRFAADFGKRLIFPSTSEVYGLVEDKVFEEDTTSFTYGPISNQRWIYAASKQLLDRIIYAYGKSDNLNYTIFRPFNWLGPQLDRINEEEGTSRLVTQVLSDIIYRRKIFLVDGGRQMRSFTDVIDGIDALVEIINNPFACNKKIYNIGNPNNEYSIRDFVALFIEEMREHCTFISMDEVEVLSISGESFYGKGYQDVQKRVPSISAINRDVGWHPKIKLKDTIRRIILSTDFPSFMEGSVQPKNR